MNWKQPKVYAVKHKDAATIAASRSGGVFTALSDWVLSKDGILHATVDVYKRQHFRLFCIHFKRKK